MLQIIKDMANKTTNFKTEIQFIKYLNDVHAQMEKNREEFLKERERIDVVFEIAEYKKLYKKFKKTHMYNRFDSQNAVFDSFAKAVIDVKDAYVNDHSFTSDDQFMNLLFFLTDFSRCLEKDISAFAKEFIKPFVKKAKETNPTLEFVNFFDDEGNIKISTCYHLIYYIQCAIKKKKAEFHVKLNEELGKKVLVTDMDIEEARLESLKQSEIERQQKEELKKQKIELKKLANVGLKKNNECPVKTERTIDPKLEQIKGIMDLETHELKDGCSKIITLEGLIAILENFLDKNALNRCIEEYQKQLRNDRLCLLKRILTKSELRKLLSVLEITDDENTAKIEFEEFIISPDFDKQIDSDIKKNIIDLLNRMINPSDKKTNYIIFPNTEFVEDEKQRIISARTHANIDATIKAATTQLHALQNNSISYMKSTLKSAFHELKTQSSMSFILDGKLKGYRYGAKKAKLCIFTISVHQDNQRLLQERYNTEVNSNVILVFGIGNVDVEDEYEFYSRAIKYASDNSIDLLNIYDIFSKPFTKETLPIALELIDNGMITINTFTETNTGKEKVNK